VCDAVCTAVRSTNSMLFPAQRWCVCCSVLQCVAMCCNVCCSVCCSASRWCVCCSALQCIAACCNVCCSIFSISSLGVCSSVCCSTFYNALHSRIVDVCAAVSCSVCCSVYCSGTQQGHLICVLMTSIGVRIAVCCIVSCRSMCCSAWHSPIVRMRREGVCNAVSCCVLMCVAL